MTDLPEFTYRLVIVVSILFSTAFAFPLAEPKQAGEWTKEAGKESSLAVLEILGKPLAEVLKRPLEYVQNTQSKALSNIQIAGQNGHIPKNPKETGVDSVQEILLVPLSAPDMYKLNTAVSADSAGPDGKLSKMSEVEKNTDTEARDQGETDLEEIVSTSIKALRKSDSEEYKAKPKDQEATTLFTPEIHIIEVPEEKHEVTIEAIIEEAFAGAESQLNMNRLLEEVMNNGLGQLLPNITGHLEKVGLDEHGSTVAVGVVEQEVWMTRDGARKPVKMRLQYALTFDNFSEIVSLPMNHTDTETNVTVMEEIDDMKESEEEEEQTETNSVNGQPMALAENEWMGTSLVPSPPRPNPVLPAPSLTPPYLTKPQLVYAAPPYYFGLYNPYYYF